MLIRMMDGQDRSPLRRAIVGVVWRFTVGPGPVVDVVLVAVLMVVVLVVADVEVDMEEAGAELAVVVPVAGGVKAETGEAGEDDKDQRGGCRPRRSGQGSAESSHNLIPR